ncbi:MAG: ABC transporter permease [Candidatus Methanofastidiosia archaeon]|jgi:ABC-type polysaccharide/polyol phosphate export permease
MVHNQIKEIYTLIKRDFMTTRFFKVRSFLTPLSFPLVYLYVGGFIYGSLFDVVTIQNVEIAYPAFLAVGLIVAQVFQGSSMCSSMYWIDVRVNMLSQLKHLGYTSRSYYLSKLVSILVLSLFNGFIFLLVALPIVIHTYAAGFIFSIVSIGITIVALLLCASVFTSFYFIIISLSKNPQTYNLISTVTLFPIMFLSETFYPVGGIPVPYVYILRGNPLSLTSNILRSVLLGIPGDTVAYVMLLCVFSVIIVSVSLIVFERGFEKKYGGN